MGCCDATRPELAGLVREGPHDRPVPSSFDRRSALKGLATAAGGLALAACSRQPQAGATVRLAFCGQLLCVVPYEVARARGHFAAEGLAVELVYTRGGNAAMQALVGGAVEYAGTSFDVALQAVANGAAIRRFASTGRLPLYALAVAPGRSAAIRTVKDLEGTTVAISGQGNADHALLLFLLDQAGIAARRVEFATIGTNVFDALRIGQVDAAMVQEPALTLIVAAGGRELVNFMDIEQARRYLGGPYEFMGVSVRAAERDARLAEMRRLAAALERGLADTRTIPPADIIAALPPALVAGSDVAQLERILERYRRSLYPERAAIELDAARRVAQSQEIAGILEAGRVDLAQVLDTAVLGT
ncbi:MAG: ABC transporter substrate-binding protein [Acidobacteria bacterium]|nr:ABC transporter substrate-binding protein [Acidobacteriota bacterium]